MKISIIVFDLIKHGLLDSSTFIIIYVMLSLDKKLNLKNKVSTKMTVYLEDYFCP